MLVPAILYKDEIHKEFKKLYYTQDMFFETGSLCNWLPNIDEVPDEGKFDFAIVENDKLIGYLSYQVDWYSSKAYNFGLASFDRGNIVIGKNLFEKMEELVKKFHRVEWRMVGNNPVEKNYDNFIKRHNGNKYILKDAIRDRNGDYHDDVIYEIVKE